MKIKVEIVYPVLIIALLLLFVLNLWFGSVSISLTEVIGALLGNNADGATNAIVVLYRLPQAVTALSTGVALSLAGLILQTLFRNPLAGPSVLGISSGASFGVAVAVLSGGFAGGVLSFSGANSDVVNVVFAFAGAIGVLSVILFVSQRISNVVIVLIVGIMTGYAVSALVSVMQFFAGSKDVYSFVMWGLGSFSKTDNYQAVFLLFTAVAGFFVSMLYVKPLNALLTGEEYSQSIGYNVKRIRFALFIITGIFIAATTAYTGPIGFIGLAVPHLARTVFKTSNHSVLLPATALMGGILALLCNFISKLPGIDISLPINAVTSLLGAPVVIWVLLKRRY